MSDGAMAGIIGACATIVLLVLLQSLLVRSARKRNPEITYWDLIVTTEDNQYSLSRLQLYLWFVVILVCHVAVSVARGSLASIPESLSILLGLNVSSSVAATAITYAKQLLPKGKAKEEPDFFADIFLDSGQSLDLPRTQMFMWTLVLLIGFVFSVVKSFDAGDPKLEPLPTGLVALMGISHGAYLGAKAAEPQRPQPLAVNP